MLSQNSEEKMARMLNYVLAETGDEKLAKRVARSKVNPSSELIRERLRQRNSL